MEELPKVLEVDEKSPESKYSNGKAFSKKAHLAGRGFGSPASEEASFQIMWYLWQRQRGRLGMEVSCFPFDLQISPSHWLLSPGN